MDNKVLEIFIQGPGGRLDAKYYKSAKKTSPIALILHPHPQYGGTMNNKIVVEIFKNFVNNLNLNLDIEIVEDGNQILDTGGGILNMIKKFLNLKLKKMI